MIDFQYLLLEKFERAKKSEEIFKNIFATDDFLYKLL